jgi:3-phenylpropionate/trans-cinnamate dioxygenase ferredoxin reductase subunit
VQVRGPFGYAYLREGTGPIVLVSGGTGWAPIWSLARAARREQPHRDLVVIAGAREPDGLYMRRSLEWLLDDGVRDVIATAESGHGGAVRPGRPTHYLPSLGLEDTVYVAGPPALVDAVKRKARAAAARCYADPFLPGAQKLSLVDRVVQMLHRSDGGMAPGFGLAGMASRIGARRIEPQPLASASLAGPMTGAGSAARRSRS